MDYQLINSFIVRYTAEFAKKSSFVKFLVELTPIGQNSNLRGDSTPNENSTLILVCKLKFYRQ